MFLEDNEENYAVSKFELMLRENNTLFFDVDEFEDIVEYYIENGRTHKAKRALELGPSQHPTAVSLKLLYAEQLVFEDQLNEATQLLEELTHTEPLNAEVYVQKANLYSKLNKHRRAIELLEYAITLTDDVPSIFALIGMEYLLIDEYANARTYFRKSVEKDPQDYTSLQQLLYCYEVLDETQEAMSFLNDYLDQNPYCEVAWYYLGRLYLSENDSKNAIRCFDFAIVSDDTFTGAYFEKARVLETIGDYERAIENYKITLTLDDPSALVYLHIGRCYEKMLNDEKAEIYYFKATHEDPQLDKAWITLADFYYLRRNHTKALKYIQKVLTLEPNEPYYWRRYAEINYFQLHNLEEAEYGYRKAVQNGDYSYTALIDWVDLMFLTRQYGDALPIIIDIVDIFPYELCNYYRLALAYHGLGKEELAYKYYQLGVQQVPEWQSFFESKFNFKM